LFAGCEKKDEEYSSDVSACFSFTYEGDAIWEMYVVFSNCSQNATSYLWDFGDGNTSAEENPVHYYTDDGAFIVCLTASNESGNDTMTDTVFVNWTRVEKPNIYLYPAENITVCVNLEFPQGGQVLTSVPEYHNEWCVFVEPSGRIDHTYDYLFYESIQPDIWQYEEGWCVKRESLEEFFMTNMGDYDFTEKEINDFIEYWIPLFVDHPYYAIYPQFTSRINEVIQLNFSIQPDRVFRLFYGVVGTSEYKELPGPETNKIRRDGFAVVEWGVFRK